LEQIKRKLTYYWNCSTRNHWHPPVLSPHCPHSLKIRMPFYLRNLALIHSLFLIFWKTSNSWLFQLK